MKGQGASLVAEDAVAFLVEHLSNVGESITKKAIEIAGKDGRKKLTGADIFAAVKPS